MAMANAVGKQGKRALTLLLGQCLPSFKQNAAKIRVRCLTLDENLVMYFRKDYFYYAHDPKTRCKPGDTVLIKQLPRKLTRLITHEVLEVVYPLGDITDPVTGKKVVVGKYREDIKMANQMYGEAESAFDYDNAPPRGSQKNKRDFTYRKTYVKYHEDPDNPQPYSL